MHKSRIFLIILNYNGIKETLECLESVRSANKQDIDLKVVVVDNNSKDESLKMLGGIKDIKLLENKNNLGFSGGMNTGIKYALGQGADHIVLLNNDTIVHKDLFVNLEKASKNGDIIAPKIYFAKGFEFHKDRYQKNELGKVIWYAGGIIDWQNIIGKHIGVDEVDKGQFEKQKEIDFATGCCLLIKRDVFEKIGYLDEKYFLYLEDMDFSFRAKNNGFKIIFDPKSILWHKNASSAGGSGSSLQEYYFTRNRLIFAFKYASTRTKLAILKHTIKNANNRTRISAAIDFLRFHYGKR